MNPDALLLRDDPFLVPLPVGVLDSELQLYELGQIRCR
jgi:hypothetical protein